MGRRWCALRGGPHLVGLGHGRGPLLVGGKDVFDVLLVVNLLAHARARGVASKGARPSCGVAMPSEHRGEGPREGSSHLTACMMLKILMSKTLTLEFRTKTLFFKEFLRECDIGKQLLEDKLAKTNTDRF